MFEIICGGGIDAKHRFGAWLAEDQSLRVMAYVLRLLET